MVDRRTAIAPESPQTQSGSGELARAQALALHFARNAKAKNTLRAYESAWRDFQAWCARIGAPPVPPNPQLVALYLAHAAEHRAASTLDVRLAALAHVYRQAGYSLDRTAAPLAEVCDGIRRLQARPPERKAPLLKADVAALSTTFSDTPIGLRNRALVLTGWAGSLRRSEIVTLNLDDATISRAGLHLSLQRSKTDAAGLGQEVAILRGASPCAVAALESWLAFRGEAPGPLFVRIRKGYRITRQRLSDKAVVRALKAAVAAVGLDPRNYAGHSLRAGLVTTAYLGGAALPTIATHTRHRSLDSLRDYIRSLDRWTDNVGTALQDQPSMMPRGLEA